jgi:hypothetical protein
LFGDELLDFDRLFFLNFFIGDSYFYSRIFLKIWSLRRYKWFIYYWLKLPELKNFYDLDFDLFIYLSLDLDLELRFFCFEAGEIPLSFL